MISTVLLTMENPLDNPDGKLAQTLIVVDYIITFVFLCEMIFKVLMLGFVFNGPDSYIRDSWNAMDFSIITVSLASIFLSGF